MKKTITLILLVLLAASCGSVKKRTFTQKEVNEKLDSIVKTSQTHIIDTLKITEYKTKIQQVESIIEIPVECDEYGNIKELQYKVKNGNNQLQAYIKDNKLVLDRKIDSTIQSVKTIEKSRYIKQIDSLQRVVKQLETKLTEEKIIKSPNLFFTHWKCWLIILVLTLYVFRRFIPRI